MGLLIVGEAGQGKSSFAALALSAAGWSAEMPKEKYSSVYGSAARLGALSRCNGRRVPRVKLLVYRFGLREVSVTDASVTDAESQETSFRYIGLGFAK